MTPPSPKLCKDNLEKFPGAAPGDILWPYKLDGVRCMADVAFTCT